MTEYPIPGPMSMIKIDGAKIKRLREEQGLTQLYLATAVQVTTDTISRWENRRYPSIKKENGIKLAEALQVRLEDLLQEEEPEDAATGSEDPAEGLAAVPADREPAARGPAGHRRAWLAALFVIAAVAAAAGYAWFSRDPGTAEAFAVERILPDHCIAGQPFPVLIRASGEAGSPTALIVRENIPQQETVKKVTPPPSAGGKKGEAIKWLKKVDGTETFAYLATVSGSNGDVIEFSGTAAVSNGGDTASAPPIGGDSKIVIDQYHWADTNRDNVISDSEILMVYNLYGEIKGLGIDIDQIEEMWLGSGYRWHPDTGKFEILD